MTHLEQIKQDFYTHFAQNPIVYRSPGRVNLIGEHTDYNEGFVLPGAINKFIYLAISPREDDEIYLISKNTNSSANFKIGNLQKNSNGWSDYIIGIVDQLIKKDYKIKGFNCVFSGDIPMGAGLSSSAALECATVYALNELNNLGISKLDQVKIAQKAENEYVGVKCGIMDQFASMLGKENMVFKLDCRSLEYEYFPLKMDGYSIVLCDSGVKHSLASSEYNVRRQQCEEGVGILKKYYPSINSLRDVSIEMLKSHTSELSPKVLDRCIYVVEEIKRLIEATEDLKNGNTEAFGKKMFETHYGLKNLYEVSCKELDILVQMAEKNNNVLGSRMMGGGFGGCTINLIKEEGVTNFVEYAKTHYPIETGKELLVYTVKLESGTCRLD